MSVQDLTDMAALIDAARAAGPMTDEQRIEQAASFAFGQLALTAEWRDRSADDLARLRATCRTAATLMASVRISQIEASAAFDGLRGDVVKVTK